MFSYKKNTLEKGNPFLLKNKKTFFVLCSRYLYKDMAFIER